MVHFCFVFCLNNCDNVETKLQFGIIVWVIVCWKTLVLVSMGKNSIFYGQFVIFQKYLIEIFYTKNRHLSLLLILICLFGLFTASWRCINSIFSKAKSHTIRMCVGVDLLVKMLLMFKEKPKYYTYCHFVVTLLCLLLYPVSSVDSLQ